MASDLIQGQLLFRKLSAAAGGTPARDLGDSAALQVRIRVRRIRLANATIFKRDDLGYGSSG